MSMLSVTGGGKNKNKRKINHFYFYFVLLKVRVGSPVKHFIKNKRPNVVLVLTTECACFSVHPAVKFMHHIYTGPGVHLHPNSTHHQ